MTLSPLIILILLLFLASIAIIFLLWSLLTLKTPHLVINSRQTRRLQKEDLDSSLSTADPPRRAPSGPKPSVYSSVVYPERSTRQKAQKSKDELKQRLNNNQVRGLNAQIPVPNLPPVEAVVTRKHSLVNHQEALEPLETESKTSKFQVVPAQGSPSKAKPSSEQVPLFDDLPTAPILLLNEDEEKEEEDVFERFIRSKNDDMGF